jgi:hypothetical protein
MEDSTVVTKKVLAKTWVLDQHNPDADVIAKAIESTGRRFILTDRLKLMNDAYALGVNIPEDYKDTVVRFYGSVNGAITFNNHFAQVLDTKLLDCTYYYPRLGNWLLNHNCILATIDMIKSNESFYQNLFPGKAFIRPTSCLKEFDGQLFDRNFIKSHLHINGNTICLIAERKNIDAETRVFIVNGKIIGGKRYMSHRNLCEITLNPEDMEYKFAEAAMSIDYDLCKNIVMDVARVKDDCKILELNSLCCAGLYGLDPMTYVTALEGGDAF